MYIKGHRFLYCLADWLSLCLCLCLCLSPCLCRIWRSLLTERGGTMRADCEWWLNVWCLLGLTAADVMPLVLESWILFAVSRWRRRRGSWLVSTGWWGARWAEGRSPRSSRRRDAPSNWACVRSVTPWPHPLHLSITGLIHPFIRNLWVIGK